MSRWTFTMGEKMVIIDPRSRTSTKHFRDKSTSPDCQLKPTCYIFRYILDRDPYPAASNFPFRFQVRKDTFSHIDRNCKTDSRCIRHNRCIDADHLTLHI
jgi:hypothetical protein